MVPEGADPFGRGEPADPYATDPYATEDDEQPAQPAEEEQAPEQPQPISTAAIDLAAGARYAATGKRKTAIARVILRPGTGTYSINGRVLEQHVPRVTLQRNVRQPLEAVGYEERMDVFARVHGGGIAAQAGALRHGIARALIEADPNLRGELKRRGLLTRDARVKERKKAGLKKARKRPQFSKR
ncbi:MAG: 30S ribosomal protein S9 [Solirubrobacteraceae bacterium]